MRTRAFILMVVLAGCVGPPPDRFRPSVTVDPVTDTGSWRSIATDEDQALIDDLPRIWPHALAAVPGRLSAKSRAEGALLDPQGAKPVPLLPIGPYRCRLVRLGGPRGFATYRPDFCYVDGDATRRSFTKQDGENLPGGWLYPDGDGREVFLGGVRQRADDVPPAYLESAATDVIGVVERVAPFRWRLVFPKARQGAVLDVYELVPLPPLVPGAP